MADQKIDKPAETLALNPQVLTSWRERMGFSQRDAAEAIGCSRGAWAGWESGKQSPIPRYIGLALAALALGMTPYGEEQIALKARDED